MKPVIHLGRTSLYGRVYVGYMDSLSAMQLEGFCDIAVQVLLLNC